jgi:DNA-directed RNA polymerase subunit RPC12/RpoP
MGNDLMCPYVNCGKGFKQPILLASRGELSRESYHACPHCHSKVDIILKDRGELGSVEAVAVADPENLAVMEKRPEGCINYVGYLQARSENTPLLDRCLTCPKVMLCIIHQ